MPKRSIDDTTGHVVHLLERLEPLDGLDAPASAPESLGLPKHLGTPGRVLFALVNVAATVGAGFAVRLLWTEETPGLWFTLLFTVMVAGIPVALWAILIGSIGAAKVDRELQATWERVRHRARVERGNVVGRRIGLAEDGSVSSFDLDVTLADGSDLRGEWRPRTASSRPLLQPQVPGVGAEVRVWRVAAPEAGDTDAAGPAIPVVIEVADASVVTPRERG